MQSENRLFDDFVKVMNGAAGTIAGMGREAENAFRERMRDWVGGLDMVSREEFEAMKAIAIAAREESAALKSRVEALEAAAAAKPKRKPAGRGRCWACGPVIHNILWSPDLRSCAARARGQIRGTRAAGKLSDERGRIRAGARAGRPDRHARTLFQRPWLGLRARRGRDRRQFPGQLGAI